jgi:hypothetical protein
VLSAVSTVVPGAELRKVAGAGDRSAEGIGVGTVNREGTVVDDITDDRPAGPAIAELQGAGRDRPILVAGAGREPSRTNDVERAEPGVLCTERVEVEGSRADAAEPKGVGAGAQYIAVYDKARPERQRIASSDKLNCGPARARYRPRVEDRGCTERRDTLSARYYAAGIVRDGAAGHEDRCGSRARY